MFSDKVVGRMAPLVNFSGLASGIDSSALIKAILDQQRKAQIDPLETRVQEYQDTNDALGELKDLLSTLSSKLASFRVVNGGALSKLASSSDETVASATAANGASSGSYTLSVSQLATNGSLSLDARYASSSTAALATINDLAPAADRTATITVGSGADQESVDVVMTSTMTIQDFVNSFNESSEKAEASLVNVGTSSSPSYAIVINSYETGEEEGELAISGGAQVSAWATDHTLSQATNAEFTLSGIDGTIERASNSIADVIGGVNLNLSATGTTTISVSTDSASTASRVRDFVDAYNEMVAFIEENDLVSQESDGGEIENIFGALAGTSIDENLVSSLRSALAGAGTSGRTVNILADLGITTQRDGTLAFDEDTFDEAISNDAEGVRIVLEDLGETTASTDGTIAQFSRYNGLIDVTTNTNLSQITSLQDRITEVEKRLAQQEESLIARFAALERIIGGLTSQQNALASLLPS